MFLPPVSIRFLSATFFVSISPITVADIDETFTLSAGRSFHSFDSTVAVGTKKLPDALPIDFEKDLDFEDNVDLNWLSGHWRFADRHQIRFDYLPIRREANAVIDSDIEFDTDIIEAGARVESDFDTAIYDISYQYSVYQRPNFDISLAAGLYWMSIDLQLKATGFIRSRDLSGNGQAEFQNNYNHSESVNAPLPLFGVYAQYEITPRWRVNGGIRYLQVSIDDVDGELVSLSIGTEYFVTERIGLGVSAGSFDLDVDIEKGDFVGSVDWGYEGAQAYLKMKY
jgi:hypothetical protein